MGLLVISLSYTEFSISSRYVIFQVYSSHKHVVEIPLPPSLQTIGFENMNFLAFPHCTAAESHNSFYLLGPLCQSYCEPVWVVHPCLWTLLVSALVTSFTLYRSFLLQWQADSSICSSHCVILEQKNVFFVVPVEHCKFDIQAIGVIFGPRKQPNLSWHFPKST